MSTQFNFQAIGTTWVIDIYDELDLRSKELLLDAIRRRIGTFDQNYSRFRQDSLVTRISQVAGEYVLPDDAQPMFDLYVKMYELTGGLMTPLIGQILSDAGYDASYSLEPKININKAPRLEDSIEYKFPALVVKKTRAP